MSTDSAIKGGEPELDYNQAHQWCAEMRAILGNKLKQSLGLGTDARKLAQAENQVFERLKEIHKLYPEGLPPQARELQSKYSQAAKDGFVLREEYLAYDKQLSALELEVKKLKKVKEPNDATLAAIEKKKLEIETLERLKEQKKDQIAQKSGEFVELSNSIQKEVDDRKLAQKDYEKNLLNVEKVPKKAVKLILAAQEQWNKNKTEAEKLVAYFSNSCDSTVADQASKEFDKCLVDLFTIKAPKDTSILAPMGAFLTTWGMSGVKGKYEEARKRFSDAYATAPSLMTEAQKVCEGKEFLECLKSFTEGQALSLQKKWIEADKHINSQLNQRLQVLINVGANGKKSWELANVRLKEIKTELDKLADPGFNILVLTPLGPAFKLAQQHNYLEAAQDFRANVKQADAALEVASLVAPMRQKLFDRQQAILEMIANIQQSSLRFLATQFQQELLGLADDFWSKRHVPTAEALAKLEKTYSDKLTTIKGIVQGYLDPNNKQTNDQLVKDIQNGGNRKACVQIIKSLIDAVAPAIREYKAAFFDPKVALPAQPLGGWEAHLSNATTFYEQLQDKNFNDSTAIEDGYKTHSQNLFGLEKTIREHIAGQANAINLARADVNKLLDWFSTKMFITRFDTIFKEATWHKEAKLEYAELKALATVDNLAQLQALLARATKLQERCAKVLKAMPQKALEGLLGTDLNSQTAVFDGTAAQREYDLLKARHKNVRKALQDKDLKFYVPRGVERVMTQLQSADAALRSDGYVGLTDQAVLDQHKNEAAATAQSLEALKLIFGQVKQKRDAVQSQLTKFQTRIITDLTPAIKKNTQTDVTAEHLPLMQAATALSLRLNTEKLDELSAIEIEIGMLGDDLILLLLAADEPNGLLAQAKAHVDGEVNKKQVLEEKCKARMAYEVARQAFDEVWVTLRKRKDVDKSERNAIRSIKNQANEATQTKPQNWAKATKDIKLALLLAERLQKNPLGSQATDRGQKHLKELTPRWIGGIDHLSKSVSEGLAGAVEKSCVADKDNVTDAAAILRLFESSIGQKFSDKTLLKDAFASELLVLQREAPSKSADKQADKQEKKKARESALVKVRNYKHMIGKDPIYSSLLYKKNPWSSKGGQVDGLPLMRALNDLELNVERGIY